MSVEKSKSKIIANLYCNSVAGCVCEKGLLDSISLSLSAWDTSHYDNPDHNEQGRQGREEEPWKHPRDWKFGSDT